MGILLSFLVAAIDAVNNLFVKKGATKFSLVTVTWAWQAFSLLIVLPALIFSGIPALNETFFISASLKVVIYLGTLLLYSASLRLADISLAVPMLAFTPLITMVISYFLSNEVPSKAAFVGVLCIISGAYWINVRKDRKGILAPIKAIFENKGVFYMFLVACLWGLTSSLDKVAVVNSSPVFYSAFVALSITLLLTPVAIATQKREFFKVFQPQNLRQLIPIGILDGVLGILQMTAVGLTLASYVVAIKRSSILISSVLGYVVFKEDIKSRIKPIVLLFIGILLIFLTR